MYGERSQAQMREELRNIPRFSIFYCGCKQPKSIHIVILSGAKVQRKAQTAK